MNDKVLAQTRDELTEKDARIQDLLEKLEGKEAAYAEL
jgi:BMFP domain-containing protein YqiC